MLFYEQRQDKLGAFVDFDELLKHCRRNNVSKALLYMQQALTQSVGGTPSIQQHQYLEVSLVVASNYSGYGQLAKLLFRFLKLSENND